MGPFLRSVHQDTQLNAVKAASTTGSGSKMKRMRAIVRGVVQGVGFRFFTRDLARRYGLGGFVMNRADGTVEVEVQGKDGMLAAFMKDLEIGPRNAHVAGIELEEIPAGDAPSRFEITF